MMRTRVHGALAIFAAALLCCSIAVRGQSPTISRTERSGSAGRLQALLVEGSQALERGDAVAAESAFRRALKEDPHSVGILNDLGIALVKQGKIAEAIPLYQRALALRPADRATTRNLAIAYFREQRYRDALPLLESLTRKMPRDFQAASLTGLSLFALNRYAEAARYLDLASSIKPRDLATLYELGQAELRAKDLPAVTAVFARISAIAPDSAEAHVMMGMAYDNAFREKEAMEEYVAAEKADPNFPGVHSGLGLLYWKLGDTVRAQAQFEQELSRFPSDAVANCMLGRILVREDKPVDAKGHFQKAVEANSRYKEAWFGLGKAELMLGNPGTAIQPLRRAIAIDHGYAQAHFLLGDALFRLGRLSEAKKEHELSAQIQASQQKQYTRKLDSSHPPPGGKPGKSPQ